MRVPSSDLWVLAMVMTIPAGILLHACSSSPPPAVTAQDLNRAVLMSRDACRQLLEVTAPEPPAEGQGGGP